MSWLMRIGRPLSDWFAEFVEQVREARCGAAVAVGLAWPAASDGVVGEAQLVSRRVCSRGA